MQQTDSEVSIFLKGLGVQKGFRVHASQGLTKDTSKGMRSIWTNQTSDSDGEGSGTLALLQGGLVSFESMSSG